MMPLLKIYPKEFRATDQGYVLQTPRPNTGIPHYVIVSPTSIDRCMYNGIECTKISNGRVDWWLNETPEEVLQRFVVAVTPPPRNFRQGVV